MGSFVGKMLRRHRLMDPELFLEFIVHRLHANSSKEVLVLKEVIGTMTSIEPLVDLNDQQVLAFGGGPLLCLEVISQSTRGSRSAGLRKDNLEGMGRLKRSLMNGQKLALPLLIALAQYRATCSYKVKTEEMHPKYLSSLLDEVKRGLNFAVTYRKSEVNLFLLPEPWCFVPVHRLLVHSLAAGAVRGARSFARGSLLKVWP